MNRLLKISEHWYGSLHQSGEVSRRQRSRGYATRENWGGFARDHLESGNHEQ
jgi:hypothetical protein